MRGIARTGNDKVSDGEEAVENEDKRDGNESGVKKRMLVMGESE